MKNKKDVEYIINDYVNKRRYRYTNEVVLFKEDYGVCIDKSDRYINVFKMYVDTNGYWIKEVRFNKTQVNANFKQSFWTNKPNTQLRKVKEYIDSRFRAVRE